MYTVTLETNSIKTERIFEKDYRYAALCEFLDLMEGYINWDTKVHLKVTEDENIIAEFKIN